MADTINSKLDGVAGFKISGEGKSIGNEFGLLSFKVSREINKIGKGLLVFEAGDMPQGRISESDSAIFDVGKSIKIEAGYGDELKSIFEGIVVYHTVDIASENNATLQIECREMPFKATKEAKCEIFSNKNDEQIIKDLLEKKEYNLSVNVEGADIEHLQFFQRDKADWETAMSRATENGLIVVVDGKTVDIAPLSSEKQNETLEYGTNIIEFNAKLNTANLYKKVVVEAVNSKKQVVLKVSLEVNIDSQPGNEKDEPYNDTYSIQVAENTEKSAMETIAKAKAKQIGMSKIQGSCKFCGKAGIEIGKTIELKGFGKRFEGNAYISGLEHDFNEDGWTTTVKFGFSIDNPNSSMGTIQKKASSNYSPVWQNSMNNLGLQIAVVTKLSEDPDKEFKIEVKIPDASGIEKTLWARLSNFWGNKGYGSFFIPEIGDEVILGFFNNDSSHPVILGTLYSSALPAPNELKDENPIQSITTKSKMKLEFDDEKKIITLETPGKNRFKISDEDKAISLTDQNQNKIVMNDNGIIIESAKAITLKAKTEIKIEAGTAIETKAKTDFKLQAMNIEGKAQTTLKMAGTASAELSASGNTTVKGAMVMIN